MLKLYFDTNIIAYLQDPESYKELAFYRQLRTIQQYLHIHAVDSHVVYSPAHLRDLQQGYAKDKDRALERLRFMSSLTNNQCVVKHFSDNEVKFEKRDATEFFFSILEFDEILYEPGTKKIDLVFLIEHCGFLDAYRKVPFKLTENGSRLVSMGVGLRRTNVNPTMFSFFLDFAEYIQVILNEGHYPYKYMRDKLKRKFSLANKIAGQNDPVALMEKLLSSSPLGRIIQKLMHESFKNDPNDLEGMITSDYMNLDLIGFKSEKITEQHGYLNVTTDAAHCLYASYCDIFVTNDYKAADKVKGIMTHYGFNVMVFKPEEFGDWIGDSLARFEG